MKAILTLLLILGVSVSPTLKVMAMTSETASESVKNIMLVHNRDCKGDKDDDCK